MEQECVAYSSNYPLVYSSITLESKIYFRWYKVEDIVQNVFLRTNVSETGKIFMQQFNILSTKLTYLAKFFFPFLSTKKKPRFSLFFAQLSDFHVLWAFCTSFFFVGWSLFLKAIKKYLSTKRSYPGKRLLYTTDLFVAIYPFSPNRFNCFGVL